MSIDVPDYQEMRARGDRSAAFWRVGDILYYLGLLSALLAIPASAILGAFGYTGNGVGGGIAFLSALAVWFAGGALKAYARRSLRRRSRQLASEGQQHAP